MTPQDLPDLYGGNAAIVDGDSTAVNGTATDQLTENPLVNGIEPRNVTKALAEFVTDSKRRELHPELVQKLRGLLLDFVGVTILGAKVAESSAPFLQAIDALTVGSTGTATVLGTAKRFPAPYAAMLNGAYAHSLDFDDTHAGGALHPGVSIIPTVLAEIEDKPASSFQDALVAMAVGYEVTCRLGIALSSGGYERGFHNTGTAGIFGAVAALAKLRNLDAKTTENALGTAVSFASGSMQYLENGSWNKRLHPGIAAFNSFTCVALAEAGMLGAARSIEGKFGFLAAYSAASNSKNITKGLGDKWEFLTTALKPYPACRMTHAHIELAARMSASNRSKPITRIHISIDEACFPIVGTPSANKVHPKNTVDAQFSVYFQTAASWLYGSEQSWAIYNHIGDPVVDNLCEKISVESKSLPTILATSVEVTWQDGTTQKLSLESPLWEDDRPPSFEDVHNKFSGLVADVLGNEKTEQISKWIESADRAPSSDLLQLLA